MAETLTSQKVNLGIVGLGMQVRDFHLPYLISDRAKDVSVRWIGGYLPGPDAIYAEPFKKVGIKCYEDKSWMERDGCLKEVDGIVVSLPNFMHTEAIAFALKEGKNVAVDKPTTITARDCRDLIALAEQRELVFLTAAQRRYEDVYQIAKRKLSEIENNKIHLVEVLMSHEKHPGVWQYLRSKSGGGALISTGYHEIDTVLWLLGLTRGERGAVSATWILEKPGESKPEHERTEDVCSARFQVDDTLFNCTVSFLGPKGSVDEDIKIFSEAGCLRMTRDRLTRHDQSAASLSFQQPNGTAEEINTQHMRGARSKPLGDFVDAVLARKNDRPWAIRSAASDSLRTIEAIEGAYRSASNGGVEVPLRSVHPAAMRIDHVAVQTSDLDRAIAFYRDVLGASVIERGPLKRRQTAWLRSGDTKIELFSNRDGERLDAWTDFYSGPVHLAFSVDDVDAFIVYAQTKGAHLHPSHPTAFVPPVPNGPKIAYLLGPDGEEVEVRPI